MGGKNKAPPPPDYSGVAAASERSAELSFQLGREQLAWAKQQYAGDREILDRVVTAAEERQRVNDADAAKDRARYEGVFQPLEDDLARDAQSFSSPARQDFEMGRAAATVAEQFEQARQSAARNLESYGVDPSSTRFAALDAGSRVAQAASQAGAANQARAQTEAIGRAMRSEAINVGRGYPGQVAGTYATALQSGNQAANSQLAGTASGASTMGTGTQWTGMGNQALGTWGNTLNMGYNNQLAAANFNAQQSSGFGALGGALLGAAGNAGGFAALFSEGGAVPDVTSGGNVPARASPTRGAAIDDVDAKLTAGEFVVPKDVVSWKGEEFFQKLIEGSRKAKPEAPAQPQYAIAPSAPTTYASRPTSQGGGALPIGG
jgi:hypothetical protein